MPKIIDGTNGNGLDPLIDPNATPPRPHHMPGDRYVRAMMVVQEVDRDGNPIGKSTAVGVTRRIDVRSLWSVGEDPYLISDLFAQHAAAALHQLIRETPQGAIVYHYQSMLSKT